MATASRAAFHAQQQVRCFASASSSSSSSSNFPNPLNVPPSGVVSQSSASVQSGLAVGGLGLNSLVRPGGRQSVSGIVATVFGGSGFLGRYIVNNLGRIGSQVVTPYRGDGMNVRHLKLAGDLGQIVPIPFDMADLDSIRRCVAKSNVVINCIGSKVETSNYSYNDVHDKIPYRLAQVCKAMGVEHFIHVSAAGAHPKSPSAFFASKAAGEESVREFYPDATILRPTVVFGPMDRFLSYYAYVGGKLYGIPMTRKGQRKLQPVFVGDIARAVLNAIADPEARGRTYELGGPDVYTEAEIVELVKKHTFHPYLQPFYMNDTMARLYGKVIGGRRTLSHDRTGGLVAAGLNTAAMFANKLSLPTIYNPDMVDQAHVDLLTHANMPSLADLGVEVAMPLESQIDRVLFAHRYKQPDRFPEAQRMRADAQGNESH